MNDITPITVGQRDIEQAVCEASMLAYISIGTWSATEKDDDLADEVKAAHGAYGDVGTFIKKLLSDSEKLRQVRAAFQAVRNHHYKLTLPWVNDPHAPTQKGPRLLPKLIYPRYTVEIYERVRIALALREEFLVIYPDEVQRNLRKLGTMATAASYPSADDLRLRFRLHVDFQPVPASSGFGSGLTAHSLERLSQNLQNKHQRQIGDAMRVVVARAKKRVGDLLERLTPDDEGEAKIFKEATIENVRDLLTLLPGWNISKDPIIEEVTADIKALVDGLTGDDLRKSPEFRSEVAADTKKIVDKMARWGF